MTTQSIPGAAARLGGQRSLLHLALAGDAVVTAVNGVAYLAAAGPIGDALGLDAGLLRGLGGFLLAFALVVAAAARSTAPARPLVGAIIAANACWAAGSLVAAIAGWGSPETIGTVWIAAQAVVVAAFAELQTLGLRRGR